MGLLHRIVRTLIRVFSVGAVVDIHVLGAMIQRSRLVNGMYTIRSNDPQTCYFRVVGNPYATDIVLCSCDDSSHCGAVPFPFARSRKASAPINQVE